MVARLTFLSGKRRFCSPAVQVKLDEDIKIMDWSICAIMISSLPDDIAYIRKLNRQSKGR